MSLQNFNEFMDNIKVNMMQSGGDFNSFKENFSNSIKTMNSQNSQYSSDPNVSFSPMETTSLGAQPEKFTMWFLFKSFFEKQSCITYFNFISICQFRRISWR